MHRFFNSWISAPLDPSDPHTIARPLGVKEGNDALWDIVVILNREVPLLSDTVQCFPGPGYRTVINRQDRIKVCISSYNIL